MSDEKNQQKPSRRERLKKGIYLIPSILTLSSIFLSFTAVIKVIRYYSEPTHYNLIFQAGFLIGVAAVLDLLDGKVARMTGTTSDFGFQLDSLADVLSFGISPAILAYAWVLHEFNRIGWLVAFIYLACGAARLARFNVIADKEDKRFFVGLPIPAAAAVIASAAVLFPDIKKINYGAYIILVLTLLVSYLMVSKIRYRSFKEVDLRQRLPVKFFLLIIAFFTIIAINWRLMAFICIILYLLSGVLSRYLPRQWDFRKVAMSSNIIDEAIGLDEDFEDDKDDLDS